MNNSFWGNPLIARASGSGEGVRKTQVFDSQGRARFHGAFEGGFSAGFFNTVGSATGWHSGGARRRTIQDYMDEDDDVLMGRGISTTEEFSDPLNLQSHQALERAWGDRSLIPGPVPNELLNNNNNASSGGGSMLLEKSMRKRSTFATRPIGAAAIKHVRKQGLGYVGDVTHHDEEESPEVVNWKRSKVLQQDDEEEALTFHVVDVEGDEEAAATSKHSSSVSAKILSQHSLQQAVWPDGTSLPPGFHIAKRQPFSLRRHPSSNPPPPMLSVPSVHVFSAGVSAPRFKRKSRWDVINEYKSAAPPEEQDARALLAARFSTAQHANPSGGAKTAVKQTRFDGFTQREFEWTPSDLLKGLFGVTTAAATTVEKHRPLTSDFKAILVPKEAFQALHSSEDSQEEEEQEAQDRCSKKKHKKHKKTKKHKHKKKRKRRSCSSSSSE